MLRLGELRIEPGSLGKEIRYDYCIYLWREFVRRSAALQAPLSPVRADDLAAVPLAALLRQFPNSDLETIEEVVFPGCANQAGEDNRNVARMATLLAGFPPSVPGVTVNRLCASGMEAVSVAA